MKKKCMVLAARTYSHDPILILCSPAGQWRDPTGGMGEFRREDRLLGQNGHDMHKSPFPERGGHDRGSHWSDKPPDRIDRRLYRHDHRRTGRRGRLRRLDHRHRHPPGNRSQHQAGEQRGNTQCLHTVHQRLACFHVYPSCTGISGNDHALCCRPLGKWQRQLERRQYSHDDPCRERDRGASAAVVITDPVAPTTDRQIPFGTVLNNVTSDQTVTVSNSGNANLAIDQIASANPLAAPFSITADHCTGLVLLPAESCTLTVRFAPTTSGPFNDTFDIPSNDPTTPSAVVSVSGTGSSSTVPQITITDPIAPTTDHQIPFGTVLNNVTSDQTVTVSNSGNADLVVGQIASANPLAAPFSIMADNCSGQSIAPAGACTLIVRFAPVTSGVFNDTFDIPSNDPTTPSATVSVSGTGNNPPTAPALVSPADGETGVGTTATFEWKTSTDPDGDEITYRLTYCTDRTLESCSHGVTCPGTTGICFAGSGLLFLGFVMTRGGRGRKYILMLMMAMLLTTGIFIVSCSSGSDSDSGGSTNMTYQVSGLANATTYYWKVVADDGKGGKTSSPAQSFTTQ